MAIGEVAKLFGVTVKTVRRWDQPGGLQAVRTPGGQRRYRTADVMAFLLDRGAA
jgi:excisionase family DNA binding protein